MDIWFWIPLLVAAALAALIIVGRAGARSRVDPTQVTIDPAVAGRVRELYAKGDKLQAVKTLRAATGLGLADAVRIADKLGAHGTEPAQSASPLPRSSAVRASIGPDNEDQLRSMVAAGQQIEAVKMVRRLTGLGPKDAKDFVDGL